MLSRMMTRREQMVLAIFALSILIGSAALILHEDAPAPSFPKQETAPPAPVVPPPSITPEPPLPAIKIRPEEAEPIGVAVMGAVQRPGLYYLPPDTRVGELIIKAGGTLPGAVVDAIDLAAPLLDGTTLSIPGGNLLKEGSLPPYQQWDNASANPIHYLKIRHTLAPQSGSSDTAAHTPSPAVKERININTASQATLETLPGIGPALAQRIIRYREKGPFRSIEELEKVNGIGPVRLRALVDQIRVF